MAVDGGQPAVQNGAVWRAAEWHSSNMLKFFVRSRILSRETWFCLSWYPRLFMPRSLCALYFYCRGDVQWSGRGLPGFSLHIESNGDLQAGFGGPPKPGLGFRTRGV
ncbi:MAG: hypothetical protein AUH13_25470 [Acidobacteria bacterium 13_2_20CM_58_27]|nr:MAG: hypothetical protein AUH13_25470 [Acidobacteria bacterium 13_2_20CM_58_27]